VRRNIRLQRTAAAIVAVVAVLCARDARGAVWADEGSAARIQVEPRQAEVYVDGQFAGLVDDFDGFSQRLRLPPGEHEIALYLDGYRLIVEKVLFRPGQTYKLKTTLEKLAPGEVAPPRPQPPAPPPAAAHDQGEGADPPRESPRQAPPTPPFDAEHADAAGTLSIRVQPAGATVRIDGEPWEGPASAERLVVRLADGTHRIEVERDGFARYAKDVVVRRGEVTRLNISLPPADR
jgi:hypothetical protein